jgi:hypothetical protein
MKVVTGKHGQTILSSTGFQLYDKIKLESGIYLHDLSSSDSNQANQLHISGVLIRVNDNGKVKYKVFSKD